MVVAVIVDEILDDDDQADPQIEGDIIGGENNQ